jgi:glycogen(starch) synthase
MTMRLLFLTNFYPPASWGGYEQWCQEVADGLRSRGHEVLVLTSNYGRDALEEPGPTWVRRELHLEMELASLRNGFEFFTARKRRESENLAQLRQLIAAFAPDAALVWGMWNLPRSLAALAEELLPARVAYYVGDYWPTLPSQYEFYWQSPARNRATLIPKALLRPVAHQVLNREKQPDLKLGHVIFPTEFMRDELRLRGISPQATEVIYGAIDTSLYKYRNGASSARGTESGGGLSLLYAGRLTPEKGVHTAVEALGELSRGRGFNQVTLTIVGTGEPDYEAHLRQLVRQEKVGACVTFLGAQPKEMMPELYSQADALLFTSVWPEPFGRVLVEAMASGAVVIGTATGGAGEILLDDKNALVFPPGDAASLAAQIMRLVESPALRRRLAEAGRHTATEKFDIRRMTEEIETYLRTLVTEE